MDVRLGLKYTFRCFDHGKLTFCCSITTPWRRMTFGCRNCAMTAASCNNLTLASFGDVVRFKVLRATSIFPPELLHTPLWTSPNLPCPKSFRVLGEEDISQKQIKMPCYMVIACVCCQNARLLLLKLQSKNGNNRGFISISIQGRRILLRVHYLIKIMLLLGTCTYER